MAWRAGVCLVIGLWGCADNDALRAGLTGRVGASIEEPLADAAQAPADMERGAMPDAGCADCPGCTPGSRRACYTGPADRLGVGACVPGVETCSPEGLFGGCEGQGMPMDETCNALDDDCDGRIDEDVMEGEGECAVGVGGCARVGLARCDADGTRCLGEPGEPRPEACNGQDDDCDGQSDEGLGVGAPCAAGVGACAREGLIVCAEGEPACGARPGPAGEETCDGVDEDCDGAVDERTPCYEGPEGTANVGRCQPGELSCEAGGCVGQVLPDAEICNGQDDDCDGQADEAGPDLACRCGPGEQAECFEGRGQPGVGRCHSGVWTCGPDGEWGPCEGARQGVDETCNGVDDDCDGLVDEGVTEVCGRDEGRCRSGVRACDAGRFGECVGARGPTAETCDGVDEDCDGAVDERLARVCGSATGACATGVQTCVNGTWAGCRDSVGPTPEVCNAVDDDCDGRTDEGVQNACGGCGPVPPEQCNGQDDDCDGPVDEGVLNACGGCGPIPREQCNERDDDCDGRVDEGTRNACGQCGDVPEEVCNGLDDDCDDAVDEALSTVCGTDVGVCTLGISVCAAGQWLACDGVEPGPERCNGDDDDCDGEVDETGELGCNPLGADGCIGGRCRCGEGPVCARQMECINGRCVAVQ